MNCFFQSALVNYRPPLLHRQVRRQMKMIRSGYLIAHFIINFLLHASKPFIVLFHLYRLHLLHQLSRKIIILIHSFQMEFCDIHLILLFQDLFLIFIHFIIINLEQYSNLIHLYDFLLFNSKSLLFFLILRDNNPTVSHHLHLYFKSTYRLHPISLPE